MSFRLRGSKCETKKLPQISATNLGQSIYQKPVSTSQKAPTGKERLQEKFSPNKAQESTFREEVFKM